MPYFVSGTPNSRGSLRLKRITVIFSDICLYDMYDRLTDNDASGRSTFRGIVKGLDVKDS